MRRGKLQIRLAGAAGRRERALAFPGFMNSPTGRDATSPPSSPPASDFGPAVETVKKVRAELKRHLHGKDAVIEALLAGFLARGHVLLEDVPGVGKTTIAHCLARTLGMSFNRIQFTSDTLPSDVLGVTIFQSAEGAFRFFGGPIFANVVLADEINRSPARTQSALLEAMERAVVSVDREQHPLPQPFLVIATQNPVDFDSTFPLPAAQLDRFALRLSVGYPEKGAELTMLSHRDVHYDALKVSAVVTAAELVRVQEAVRDVFVEASLLDYMHAIAAATRQRPDLAYGVSPRGLRVWKLVSQAAALLAGREFVTPDDVKRFAPQCLAHRVRLLSEDLSTNAWTEAAAIVTEVIAKVPVPHVREGRRHGAA
jgi:MoxR-like ATPase